MKAPFAVALLVALTAAAAPAMAQQGAAPAMAQPDDMRTCRLLASQVHAAIKDATGDVAAARRENVAGMQACNFALYKNGSDHYRKALSLLGK